MFIASCARAAENPQKRSSKNSIIWYVLQRCGYTDALKCRGQSGNPSADHAIHDDSYGHDAMQVLVGLAVFFMMSGVAFYLAGTQRIHASVTAVLLFFSLLSGFVIANYDWLERLRFEVPGLQVYKDELGAIREEAARGLRAEVLQRKGELSTLLAEHGELTAQLESRKKDIETILEALRRLDGELKEREKTLRDLVARAEQSRDQMVAIQNQTSELALMLTRTIWLQVQAAHHQNPEVAEAAVREVLDGLDAIVALVISDPKARSEFVSGVMSSVQAPRP